MWTEAPLEAVLDLIIDHRGRTPRKLGADFVDAGVQVISAQNITGNRLDLGATSRFVSPEIAERWMPVSLMPGDVLLSSEAPLGCVAPIPEKADSLCVGQRLFALRPDRSAVDPDFLLVVLRSDLMQDRLRARATGTTVQGIKQAELRRVAIPVPPLNVQRSIALVIRTLDEKIESNRRLAEAGARVVLESGEHLANHAPTRVQLHNLADQVRIAGRSERPYVGLEAMTRGSTVLSEWKTESAPAGASWAFEPQDVLFGKLRPYFRKVAVAPIAGRCTREIIVLRPSELRYFGLLVSAIASQRFIDHCAAIATGTRMPRAEWNEASQFKVGLPSDETLDEFTMLARASYRKVAALVHESRTLTDIRDALLPKLISGQIRVPGSSDPEEQVGAAVEALA